MAAHLNIATGRPVRVDGDSFSSPGGRPADRAPLEPLDPADDHRVAMALAVAATIVPGLRIAASGCVGKSWPRFWQDWHTLVGGGR